MSPPMKRLFSLLVLIAFMAPMLGCEAGGTVEADTRGDGGEIKAKVRVDA